MENQENRRLTNIQEGDLVLFILKKRKMVISPSPYLMIVDEISFSSYPKGITYFYPKTPAYKLIPSNSVPHLSGVEVRYYTESKRESKLNDYRIGKKDIIDYLKEKGMDLHVSWIERLPEKPDKLPGCKRIEYIPID